MYIEIKLAFNNLRKYGKRTLFTIISIILCSILLFTTMLMVSSIKSGIDENRKANHNDYSFIIKDVNIEDINKIKQKPYVEKIYIQEKETQNLRELTEKDNLTNTNNINVYIQYTDIRKAEEYSTQILKEIGISTITMAQKCSFNENLLMIYGLIDMGITQEGGSLVCKARLNYSYALNIMLILIIVAFSILFIIVLYNSFLITIDERRKEYAILNSVGATEGQILKMLFTEIAIMGIIGIIIGGAISVLCANIILNLLNHIIMNTGYVFKLVLYIPYCIASILIIIINLYISALLPSVKASTASVIQGIRNNNEIKYKKKKGILQKKLPIEGKLAIKNIKRMKNKYRVITILLVVCMTSYITISTYINYEEKTAELVTGYDVDAKLTITSMNIDYKSILRNYEIQYNDKIEYIEYKEMGPHILVEPTEALIPSNQVTTYEDGKVGIDMRIIGLDNETYKKYVQEVNGKEGDWIIYNNTTTMFLNEKETKYIFSKPFKEGYPLKLNIVEQNFEYVDEDLNLYIVKYEKIDNESFNKKIILTDKLVEGFQDIQIEQNPAIFVNKEEYNKIEEELKNYSGWMTQVGNLTFVKIKCNNIVGFSNYIESLAQKLNDEFHVEYYSLNNQKKIMYIEIIHLILRIFILAILIIGMISTINIISASIYERKQDFTILHSLGATKANINKILIFECIYMLIKALMISIILSIPIIYAIIKYMQNMIVTEQLLIPFGEILVFLVLLFFIAIVITTYSSRTIKNE